MVSNEPLLLPFPATTLVVGLEWLPLLGGKPERLGLRLARQHKATHMVLAGESAGSVGLVSLKAARAQRKIRLHSAAQNVAQLFSTGTIALLLELEQAGYWLVAVHEGAVVARTDRLYPSIAGAQPVLDELRHAYPQLLLLGGPQAPELPSLAVIEAASSPHSRLHVLNRWKPMLPWPVQCFMLALALVLLIPRVWQAFRSNHHAAPVKAAVEPRLAWQLAFEKEAQNRSVHGVQGTRVLLDALHGLPVRISGWALLQAECSPRQGKWRCQARYQRRSAEASNNQFLAGAPDHWTVEFISMDQAQSAWETVSHSSRLQARHLKTSLHNERELFSALQMIQPAFSQMQIGKPAALPVPIPTDEQGKPVPRPPGVAAYTARPVMLSGPLRSGGLLLPHTASMEWNKAVLSLRNVEQPGLKSSSLSLSLQGVLYETETLATHQSQVASPPPASVADAEKSMH